MIDVGQQLGGYTILNRIGRGGMGDVFLAQHRRVARRAAVKVLVPELSQKAAILERFFNEARATSLIKHPGIVEILDCDVLDGQAFIIMEFLEGENLGAYLHRRGPLLDDLPFLFGASLAVASAVGAAHATQIIHRDLKPDNIYLHLPSDHDPSVTVKILDFGIAKLVQTDGGHGQTSTGMLLGTPAYMSPEQCRGAGRVDARSDVYSLGCILYEAVCGTPPFVREGMGDLIVAHVSEDPEPPSTRNPALPPALNDLIVRMLAKRPDSRPQSMDDVANQLRACAEDLGIAIDQRLRPTKPVERPQVAIESAVTQRPITPVGTGPQGTMPLVPQRGSGPVAGHTVSHPTASLSAMPSGRAAVGSGAVRGGPGDGDDDGDFAAPQPQSRAGGTRVLEPQRTSTTLSAAASEIGTLPRSPREPAPGKPRGPRLILMGGGVVLAGAIAIIVATRPRPAVTSEAAAPLEPPTATVEPPPPPVAPPPAPVVEKPVPSTVRIDVPGVPDGTVVTVDGQAASLPIELPRNAASHQVVLKPPGGPEKTLTLDGTRDRLIELVFEAPNKGAQKAPHGSDKAERSEKGSRRSSSGSRERAGAADKRPAAGASDREAITDI